MANIVKHKIGLPVWDEAGNVVDIVMKNPGDTLTKAELSEARQSKDEQDMLIQHNCYTESELDELRTQREEAKRASAAVTDADEALPTQEDK